MESKQKFWIRSLLIGLAAVTATAYFYPKKSSIEPILFSNTLYPNDQMEVAKLIDKEYETDLTKSLYSVEIAYCDLDDDRKPEVIALAYHSSICGSGGIHTEIFKRNKDHLQKVWEAMTFGSLIKLPHKTNGMYDIAFFVDTLDGSINNHTLVWKKDEGYMFQKTKKMTKEECDSYAKENIRPIF